MHIIGKFDVSQDNGATTYRATLANSCAACNTDASSHCGMVADLYVMGYLDLIVQLNPITDYRIFQCSAVNRSIGPDFNIISDNNGTSLWNF